MDMFKDLHYDEEDFYKRQELLNDDWNIKNIADRYVNYNSFRLCYYQSCFYIYDRLKEEFKKVLNGEKTDIKDIDKWCTEKMLEYFNKAQEKIIKITPDYNETLVEGLFNKQYGFTPSNKNLNDPKTEESE